MELNLTVGKRQKFWLIGSCNLSATPGSGISFTQYNPHFRSMLCPAPTTLKSVSARPLIAIVGPTGSGKSDLSLRLCEEFGGEVVNCDSLQIYRYFDIGTAKLPAAERRGIPHHMLDIVNPDEIFTVVAHGEVVVGPGFIGSARRRLGLGEGQAGWK